MSAVLCLTVARDAASQFRDDAFASLVYVVNWAFIFGDQSYFETMGRPALLQHLWSLAVEEQFYLLWPVALVLIYRSGGRSLVGRVALMVALAATGLMTLWSMVADMPGTADASRLYFGTDTHCMGLLLGAALATIWRPGALPGQVGRRHGFVLWIIGFSALMGLGATFHVVNEGSEWLYRGGFLVVSALAAAVVAVAAHPGLRFGALLGRQPIRYLGQRSYGLYLYHWPIFLVTRPELDVPFGGWVAVGIRCGLTMAVAEVSYRYLEMPIRRGALRRTWSSWSAHGRPVAAALAAASVLAAMTIFGVTTVAVSAVPAPSGGDYLHGETRAGGDLAQEARTRAMHAMGSQARPSPGASLSGAGPSAIAPGAIDYSHEWVTALGDSVMLGARDELERRLTIGVDATVSRDWPGIRESLASRRAYGLQDDVVVIHTGTNGPTNLDGLRGILRSLKDSSVVVLVTVRTPRWWMDESNSTLRVAAREFANVRLAEWDEASAGHTDYFVVDGTHLTGAGVAAYVNCIRTALRGSS